MMLKLAGAVGRYPYKSARCALSVIPLDGAVLVVGRKVNKFDR